MSVSNRNSGIHAQAHEKCAMKMKESRKKKKRRAPKKEGVYKVRTENSYHGYQTTSGQ